LPLSNAIAGIDLADAKQMVVVTDHESRVSARRVFRRAGYTAVPGPAPVPVRCLSLHGYRGNPFAVTRPGVELRGLMK
jgi:hypothetical protein